MKTTLCLCLTLAILILAGCSSEDYFSPAAITTETVDMAPPAIPTGLSATTGSSVIKLAWDPNFVNDDFQGFLVYRLAFDNAYLLTPTPILETAFIDRKPLGSPCGYAISAVDELGNESAFMEVQFRPSEELPEITIGR